MWFLEEQMCLNRTMYLKKRGGWPKYQVMLKCCKKLDKPGYGQPDCCLA